MGVKGNQKLKTYVKDLRGALKEAGIPFDNDKFVPHITLIRKAASRRPYEVHLNKAEMKNGKVDYREI